MWTHPLPHLDTEGTRVDITSYSFKKICPFVALLDLSSSKFIIPHRFIGKEGVLPGEIPGSVVFGE